MDDNAKEKNLYRPLGVVKQLLEEVGAEVTYAYDDLVFVKHNHFLLQFRENNKMFYYGNTDIEKKDMIIQYDIVKNSGSKNGIDIDFNGKYHLSDGEDDNMVLELLPAEID